MSYGAQTMSYGAPAQYGGFGAGAGAAYGAMPHMMDEKTIREHEEKLTGAVTKQVTARKEALTKQFTATSKALDDECTRVISMASSQADAQLTQQKQVIWRKM